MTYPAGYLAWLEALDSRFNITAGHIWDAAQLAERERIKAIIRQFSAECSEDGEWVRCCEEILEVIDATTE